MRRGGGGRGHHTEGRDAEERGGVLTGGPLGEAQGRRGGAPSVPHIRPTSNNAPLGPFFLDRTFDPLGVIHYSDPVSLLY